MVYYLLAALVYAGTTGPILYQVVNPDPYETEEACIAAIHENAEKHDRDLIMVDGDNPYWYFRNGAYDVLTDCVPGQPKDDNTTV